ncbi:hypothetical protein KNP414_03846 [Paenibacillus mucilaginosus KNP414]|uniref:Uncharacterized protein n=1 Tax=Paenibacillus mucilaginosus (strain KNP414) TaxID=1036673 RepID=F8F6B1_PAEMK|nr:hypothetical protein KNP414_03846 [Paenibacillus mucilaginosus KNP414]
MIKNVSAITREQIAARQLLPSSLKQRQFSQIFYILQTNVEVTYV